MDKTELILSILVINIMYSILATVYIIGSRRDQLYRYIDSYWTLANNKQRVILFILMGPVGWLFFGGWELSIYLRNQFITFYNNLK